MVKLYQSRLILIGSMNPEEGRLRPQILDRLGLRVWVGPLPNARERLEIYRRAIAFRQDRTAFRMAYAQATTQLRLDVLKARELLPKVHLTKTAERYAMQVITQLAIPSHRAEIVLLEAARARAAAAPRLCGRRAGFGCSSRLTLDRQDSRGESRPLLPTVKQPSWTKLRPEWGKTGKTPGFPTSAGQRETSCAPS